MNTARNNACPCGSGEKYKKCCGGATKAPTALAPGISDVRALVALFQDGRYYDLEERVRLLLQLQPLYGFGWKLLGAALQLQGKPALAALERAAELLPDDAEAHSNLGASYQRAGRSADAQACLQRALAINPNLAQAHSNLGVALKDQGYIDQAVQHYQRALVIMPEFADAHSNLGAALLQRGQPAAACKAFESALQINPTLITAHSNLLCLHNCLQYLPAQDLLAAACRYGELVIGAVNPFMEWPNLRDPLRRLRIGLLSTDLRSHPVGYFLESVLSAIRADHRLECVAYASQLHNDAVSNRLKSLCLGGWHDVVNCSDAELAQRIHADGIDILLDLNGHTANNRLTVFAYRPAPVQVSWLGYFATTGLGAMDYLLADPLTLPPDLEPCFSEKIWRLPHTRLCFTPPELDLTVPPLPAIANGYITFGCFHSLSKINDAVLTLWANLMQAVPHSRLLLKARELDDIAARQSLISAFAVLGINPQRLDFEGQTPRADYLAAYGRIDILLDTFPYPGGTATVEALWMGVPVITMGGPSFLSRQGLGLLMNVGLPDWVATDANDYLARAVAHANAPDRLVVIRDGLRQRLLTSPLCDAPSFASDLSHALRGMWQRWCESKS